MSRVSDPVQPLSAVGKAYPTEAVPKENSLPHSPEPLGPFGLGQAHNPGSAIIPGKFLSWRLAAQLGGNYLARFTRRRAGLGPLNRTSLARERTMREGTASLSPPGFDFRSTLPADFIPTAVVTGDFNGDGHMDWAVANGGSNDIWIYLGNGDGTAQLPTIITLTGRSPVGLAAVDMNHDGKLDLVVAESDSSTVGILLGNGDGTFGPERETSLPGGPACMAVADFNGDGNADVVVGMAGVATGQLLFLPGDGSGNLGTPVVSSGLGDLGDYLTFDLEVADLNNDGKPDIVALDYRVIAEGTDFWDQMPYAGARVYLNSGSGLFNEGQQFYSDSNTDPEWGGIKSATAVALKSIT